MFVHIGGNVSVVDSEVTAVIDLENCPPTDKDMNDFIRAEEESMRIEYLSGDLPKSLIITAGRTYVSPLSVSVILRRLKHFDIGD